MSQTVLLGDLVKKGWLTYGDGNYSSKYPKSSELMDNGEIPFISGKNLKGGRVSFDGMRYITAKQHSELKKGHVKAKDTLLVTRAGVGEVAYVSNDFDGANINAQLVFLRPDGINVDHNFFYQLLSSDLMRERLVAHSSGSAQGQLPIKSLLSVKIELPDIETQKKIADVLGTIDEKIELNRQMNETLEQMGQALFRHYFIENPEAEKWEETRIGEMVNIKGGGTPSTKISDFWDGDVAWTSPRDLTGKDDVFLLSTDKTISERGLTKISSGLLPVTTLLLSSRAPIGYVAIAGIPLAINQGYIAFVPGAFLSNYFMYFWLYRNMDRIKNAANGSTFMEISKSAFRNITTKKPSDELLKKFDDDISDVFRTILNNQEQIKTLTALRDTLLPRLINGKVKL